MPSIEPIWTERSCIWEDEAFVNGLVRETIFPLVREFHAPDEAQLMDRFARKFAQHIILLDSGEPIGFYLVERQEEVLHIRRLFLVSSRWGRGIGAHLMRRFETLGPKTLRLEVWENNPAVAFYAHLGYRTVAAKGHKLVMEKTL